MKLNPILIAAIGVEDFDVVKEVIDLEEYSTRIKNALPGDPKFDRNRKRNVRGNNENHPRKPWDGKENARQFLPFCFSELGLTSKSPQATESEKYLRIMSSSAKEMTLQVTSNRAGTGHGRVVGGEPIVTEADASLVASIGFILTAWLARHHSEKT